MASYTISKLMLPNGDECDIKDTKYSEATQSAAGLMSATDKAKLDGIAAGAQVNSITGVKGNAENDYRTGNVNLTPADIGAVSTSTVIDVPHGGTGANTAAGARTNIGAAAASDVTHVYRDVNLIGHPLDTSSYAITFETVGKNVYITFRGDIRAHTMDEVFMVIPEGYRSGGNRYFPAAINNTACGVQMQRNGNVSIWSNNPGSGRIYLAMSYCIE